MIAFLDELDQSPIDSRNLELEIITGLNVVYCKDEATLVTDEMLTSSSAHRRFGELFPDGKLGLLPGQASFGQPLDQRRLLVLSLVSANHRTRYDPTLSSMILSKTVMTSECFHQPGARSLSPR